MNNLYNATDLQGIIDRLEKLTPDAPRQWGKMDVSQMLAHCNASMETGLGLNFPKRMFIGRILGPVMKRRWLNDQPMEKNSPTDPNYVMTDTKDFEQERARAIKLVKAFHQNGPEGCATHPHPFFGKFSPDDWAILYWKHFDHHLRQFGA